MVLIYFKQWLSDGLFISINAKMKPNTKKNHVKVVEESCKFLFPNDLFMAM